MLWIPKIIKFITIFTAIFKFRTRTSINKQITRGKRARERERERKWIIQTS